MRCILEPLHRCLLFLQSFKELPKEGGRGERFVECIFLRLNFVICSRILFPEPCWRPFSYYKFTVLLSEFILCGAFKSESSRKTSRGLWPRTHGSNSSSLGDFWLRRCKKPNLIHGSNSSFLGDYWLRHCEKPNSMKFSNLVWISMIPAYNHFWPLCTYPGPSQISLYSSNDDAYWFSESGISPAFTAVVIHAFAAEEAHLKNSWQPSESFCNLFMKW